MSKKSSLKPISAAIGGTFAVTLAGAPLAKAADDPFGLTDFAGGGYLVAQGTDTTVDDKPAEGKCGEGKCGEGKCAAAMQGQSGGASKMSEGRCGAMDLNGMVMNENTDELPPNCSAISEEVKITVKAGRKYARKFNGSMFAFDKQQWDVKPCAKITVKFINEDDVRHQWMVHGLPRYLYPQGMFHMEINGQGEKTGTFILPNGDKTYLVHCDIAQHMEKGMKAQLKAGEGDADLPSIPGITGPLNPDVAF